MDGDTEHEKSVVRQVNTSSVQPHWHLMRCSRSSRCWVLSSGRAFGLGARRTGRTTLSSITMLDADDTACVESDDVPVTLGGCDNTRRPSNSDEPTAATTKRRRD